MIIISNVIRKYFQWGMWVDASIFGIAFGKLPGICEKVLKQLHETEISRSRAHRTEEEGHSEGNWDMEETPIC